MGILDDMKTKAVADDAQSVMTSVYSDVSDDFTLPGDEDELSDFDDDAESVWSDPGCFDSVLDRVQRRAPFRLPASADVTESIYEGWTIFVGPDMEEYVSGTRILGVEVRQDLSYPENRMSVESTSHSQEQLAALHLEALDKYHGSHRSGGGCLPLRRIFSRRARKPYDDALDARIRKLPDLVQAELSDLLRDRAAHSSTPSLQREFTVVAIQERLRHSFAKSQPTPARRHRFRRWKDNTRGQETEFFVVVVGRLAQSSPELAGGTREDLPFYSRHTNPWREADNEEARRAEAAERRAARARAALRRKTMAEEEARFPRPALRRRPPPPPAPVAPPPPPMPAYPFRPHNPVSHPLGPPGRPHPYWMTGPHPPMYFPPPPPPPPPPMTRPPVFAHTLGLPPTYPTAPPPPHPGMMPPLRPMAPPRPMPSHPQAYFGAGPPPSVSWPPSPTSVRQTPPGSSYGPPPPPQPFSALTTPSSLSSIHMPMFCPIAPPPPPPTEPTRNHPAFTSPCYVPFGARMAGPPPPPPPPLDLSKPPTKLVIRRPTSPACSNRLRLDDNKILEDFDFDSFLRDDVGSPPPSFKSCAAPNDKVDDEAVTEGEAKSLAKDKPERHVE